MTSRRGKEGAARRIPDQRAARGASVARAGRPRRRHAAPRPSGPCIVGIGASAGGFDAIREFLRLMPPDSGIAFIVIQHLDPRRRSLASELLGKCTSMPVVEADDGMRGQARPRLHQSARQVRPDPPGYAAPRVPRRATGPAPADRPILPHAGRRPARKGDRHHPFRKRCRRGRGLPVDRAGRRPGARAATGDGAVRRHAEKRHQHRPGECGPAGRGNAQGADRLRPPSRTQRASRCLPAPRAARPPHSTGSCRRSMPATVSASPATSARRCSGASCAGWGCAASRTWTSTPACSPPSRRRPMRCSRTC